MKKSLFAVVVLACVLVMLAPLQAKAQVSIGVAVGAVIPRPYVVAPPLYGYAVVPGPYVVAPSPYVAVARGYYYPHYFGPGRVFVGDRWVPRTYANRYAGPRRYWRR
jgi:hypothetical protein